MIKQQKDNFLLFNEILNDKRNAKIFREKLKEFDEKKRKINNYLSEYYERLEKYRFEKKDLAEIWTLTLIKYWEKEKEKAEKDIKRFEFYYKKCLGKIKETKGNINETHIAQAKTVPIESFMPYKCERTSMNRKYYLCPLHKEDTPSFVEYTDQNTYSCFGCSQAGDNIDLYMKLNNCDFITAVKDLINLI